MKTMLQTGLILIISMHACIQEGVRQPMLFQDTIVEANHGQMDNINTLINPEGMTVHTRIMPPAGSQRIITEPDSFADYLRELPLKPHNSLVHYYNGNTKPNQDIYDAIVNLNIGKKDLHQCADAVIRLRAEYLWKQKQYNKIHFNFTNGFRADYSGWMQGKRIVVNGNSVCWKQKTNPSNTYQDFWEYMEVVFMYAGTLSLSKELKPVGIADMKIGDVFIQGGSPGHAVIVVDMADNNKTGEKFFLLAQSYMPAQEIQILKNPNDETISPWYLIDEKKKIVTPEWIFTLSDLMRFEN